MIHIIKTIGDHPDKFSECSYFLLKHTRIIADRIHYSTDAHVGSRKRLVVRKGVYPMGKHIPSAAVNIYPCYQGTETLLRGLPTGHHWSDYTKQYREFMQE